MNYYGRIIDDMARILDLFCVHCSEKETLDWLRRAVRDKGTWQKAHGVHGHIRNNTVKAGRNGNQALEAQYLFEEVCAKTLYNLSKSPAPFDPDSPYWVLPNALAFARRSGIPEAAVLACVTDVLALQ
jgi:hypothetical protein